MTVIWFANLFATVRSAVDDSDLVDTMVSDARLPRAGQQQKGSGCGIAGHKNPRHATDQQRAIQAFIEKPEFDVRDGNERAEITAVENRQQWAESDKPKKRLILAEGMASVVLHGEAGPRKGPGGRALTC